MRVAVALTGEMRGDAECLRLLMRHVVEPFLNAGAMVDVFAHTRKDRWWMHAVDLLFRGLWVEENRRRDESLILGEHNPPRMGSYKSDDPNDRRAFLYQSYLQQYWSMVAVRDMVMRAERQDGARYDWIVRSRPDIYLKEPLPIKELPGGVVSCPWNEWWPYEVDRKRVETVNDKFAVGPRNAMLTYLSKLIDLREYCDQFRLQGEWFTAWQMNLHGIKWVRHGGIETIRTAKLYECSERP